MPAAGLALLESGAVLPDSAALIRRYRLPEPRLALGRELCGLASAGLDVSDGLIADLGHIAEVSQVRLIVEAGAVPRSQALRALWGDDSAGVLRALTAGDDYELAFTAAPARRQAVIEVAGRTGVAVTQIGRVEAGAGVTLQDASGQPIPVPTAGWTHF